MCNVALHCSIVVPCFAMLCNVVLYCAMLRYVELCCTVVLLCVAMLCYCCAMFCYVVQCCAMLCYVVPCCAMLCYVVHCCAIFCHGVLCGHLAALTRSHLIGDHPSGLTKEQTTETMDPSPKTKGLRLYLRQ